MPKCPSKNTSYHHQASCGGGQSTSLRGGLVPRLPKMTDTPARGTSSTRADIACAIYPLIKVNEVRNMRFSQTLLYMVGISVVKKQAIQKCCVLVSFQTKRISTNQQLSSMGMNQEVQGSIQEARGYGLMSAVIPSHAERRDRARGDPTHEKAFKTRSGGWKRPRGPAWTP